MRMECESEEKRGKVQKLMNRDEVKEYGVTLQWRGKS